LLREIPSKPELVGVAEVARAVALDVLVEPNAGPTPWPGSLTHGYQQYLERADGLMSNRVRGEGAFGLRITFWTFPGRTYRPMYQCASMSTAVVCLIA
jgi:hypothetical protein